MDHPAIETLARALAALDADACVRIVEEVGKAMGPDRLLSEVFLPALSRLGDIWAHGLLDDLAFAQAAVISEQLWGLLPGTGPHGGTPGRKGVPAAGPAVVVGTVAPDLHDIGKNQLIRLLGRSGVRVHDLGAAVRPETFAEKAKEVAAAWVLVSASTRAALASVAEVHESLEAAGLTCRIIVGGDAAACEETVGGADAVAADAYEAVEMVAGPGG
jgi:methanogenic corrinoid protein MtbC1